MPTSSISSVEWHPLWGHRQSPLKSRFNADMLRSALVLALCQSLIVPYGPLYNFERPPLSKSITGADERWNSWVFGRWIWINLHKCSEGTLSQWSWHFRTRSTRLVQRRRFTTDQRHLCQRRPRLRPLSNLALRLVLLVGGFKFWEFGVM